MKKHDNLAVARRSVTAGIREIERVKKYERGISKSELESYPLAIAFKWESDDLRRKSELWEASQGESEDTLP